MAEISRRSGVQNLLLAVVAGSLPAQTQNPHQDTFPVPGVPEPARLPNGKLQRDEILKAEYDQNVRDARDLVDLSKTFELDLERSDRFVLSLGLLKKLDDIEKIARRIRGRMKR